MGAIKTNMNYLDMHVERLKHVLFSNKKITILYCLDSVLLSQI